VQKGLIRTQLCRLWKKKKKKFLGSSLEPLSMAGQSLAAQLAHNPRRIALN
jgi:hypothetical protein